MSHTTNAGRSPVSRRSILRAAAAVPLVSLLPATTAGAATLVDAPQVVGRRELQAIEARYGTRLGVYARNLVTGVTMLHRHAEAFPIYSVFKTLAAAAVLRDLDHAGEVLDRRIFYTEADLAAGGRITREHLADGMTVRELCDAAIRYSDNTAANLLLELLGGPAAVTRFARSLGDHRTRLDRWEPELNTAYPHDLRDTTTPATIAATYRKLVLGDALATDDRDQLTRWLLANTTSGPRFRAGLPDGWLLGDKTGAGDYGALNDVGIAWTPAGVPIVIAALSHTGSVRTAKGDDRMLADVARLVSSRL